MAISSIGKQETIKLDLYDKKILWELSLNSRIPRKQLAKKIKISQERLHYKINRLTKELIDSAIIINYCLLGIDQHIILANNLEQETLDKLHNDASIFALIQNIGKYQYLLYVVTEDLDSFCKEFLPNNHIEIYPIIGDIPDNYNGFNLNVKHPLPIKKDKKVLLDKKDYKILYYLSKNPLGSILKLSEKTKFDRKTIISRIKKLEDTNVIKKFNFAVNILKLGVVGYFLKIDIVPKNKNKILSIIRANNYSGFVYETYTGYFMWYMPSSHKELFKFENSLKAVDNTIKIDALQTAEILKLETVPKKILEIFIERSQ